MPTSSIASVSAAVMAVCCGAALACSSSEAGPPAGTGAASAAGASSAGTNAGASAAGTTTAAGAPSGGQGVGGAAAGSASAAGAGAAGSAGSAGSDAGSAGAAGSGGAGAIGGAAAVGIVATPIELVFGAVQKTQSAPQTLVLQNPSAAAVQLTSVTLDPAAAGTSAFELIAAPPANAEIAAGATANVQVRFRPGAVAQFKTNLLVDTKDPSLKLSLGIFGLGTKGLEGDNEPFLKPVLDTLGYAVNVGGSALLSTTTPLVGDEVAAPRFKAASGAAEIALIPVARYSPQEPIPYGYYGASDTQVGVISDDQYQALNPKTDAGSMRTFAPPAGEFGIYTTSKTHKTCSEDSKNAANEVKHAVRTYPLKDRAGKAVPNSYLVCFEEAANGDYQDYVFTLSNVVPVSP